MGVLSTRTLEEAENGVVGGLFDQLLGVNVLAERHCEDKSFGEWKKKKVVGSGGSLIESCLVEEQLVDL